MCDVADSGGFHASGKAEAGGDGNGTAGARCVEEILARGGAEPVRDGMIGDEPHRNCACTSRSSLSPYRFAYGDLAGSLKL